MAIFKLLVLSYMLTTIYIFSFIRTILPSSMFSENTNVDFFRLFKYGGRTGKGIVKFCHPLQVANFSMRLVQNSLSYVNVMTFESILDVFLLKTGMFQRIKN